MNLFFPKKLCHNKSYSSI